MVKHARRRSAIRLSAVACLLATVLTLAGWRAYQAATLIRFAHVPAIANDGRIAFGYHDDIWVTDADGSHARRITANVANDFAPRFSPDGKWIAFTSNRTGNNDVFVVASDGGEPRQLTYTTANDEALYWTPDGKALIIASNRGPGAFGSPLYRLPLEGEPAEPLAMGSARLGMMKQDASVVAYNRTLPSTGVWRKAFKGNSAVGINLLDMKSGEITEITNADPHDYKNHVNDVYPMWGADGLIYFASERDGTYNIWRMPPKGGPAQQVTHLRTGGVFYPSISPDGRKIVFQNDFDLWTLDLPDGSPKKVYDSRRVRPEGQRHLDHQQRQPRRRIRSRAERRARRSGLPRRHPHRARRAGRGRARRRSRRAPGARTASEFSPDGKIAGLHLRRVRRPGGVALRRRERTRSAADDSAVGKDADHVGAELAEVRVRRRQQALGGGSLAPAGAAAAARDSRRNPAGGFSIVRVLRGWRPGSCTAGATTRTTRTCISTTSAARKEYNVTQSPARRRGGALTPDGKTVVFTSNRDGGANQLFVVSLARLTEDAERSARARARGSARRRLRRGAADVAAAQVRRDRVPSRQRRRRLIELDGIEKRARQTHARRQPRLAGSSCRRTDARSTSRSAAAAAAVEGAAPAPAPAPAPAQGRGAATPRRRTRARASSRSASTDATAAGSRPGTFPGMTPTPDRRAIFFRAACAGAAGNAPGGRGGGGAGGPGDPSARARNAAARGPRQLRVPGARQSPRGVEADVRGDVAGDEVPLLQPRDERLRLDRAQGEVRADPRVRGHERGRLRPRQRDDRRDEQLAHGHERPADAHDGPRSTRRASSASRSSRPAGNTASTTSTATGRPTRSGSVSSVGDYVLAIDGHDLKAGDNYWKILSEVD